MVPSNKIETLGDFRKGELVAYSNFQHPFRIMTLEAGTGKGSRKLGVGGVAWIGETRATGTHGNSRVMRVPLVHLKKTRQQLGKL